MESSIFSNTGQPEVSALTNLAERKKAMLKISLKWVWAISILTVITTTFAKVFAPDSVSASEANLIYTTCGISLAASLITPWLIRKNADQPAINIFIIGISLAIIVSDSPIEMIYGRSSPALLIPVVLAGVFLSKRAAYVAISLITVYMVGGWLFLFKGELSPNFPFMGVLIFLAMLIDWPLAFLEKTVKNLESANKSLRESEERYRRLVNALPVGIIVHKQGQITYVNPAGGQLLGGYNADNFIGKPVLDRVDTNYREVVHSRIQQTYAGQAANSMEEKLVRLDGATFDAEVSAIPFEFDGAHSTLAIYTDITERKKAQQELVERNQRLQEVSKQLLEVQENEKRSLAAELHDDLGQSLTSLKMMLELAMDRPAEQHKQVLEDASDEISDLMSKVRNISLDLRPSILDDFGLFPALQWLFERFNTQTQIEIHTDFNLESEQRFETQVEITAFRIIQESLTNIARHASVRDAYINLDVGQSLRIKIEDYGQGFNSKEITLRLVSSSGLSGMQERARLVGGHVDIRSRPGQGTQISVDIPLTKGDLL